MYKNVLEDLKEMKKRCKNKDLNTVSNLWEKNGEVLDKCGITLYPFEMSLDEVCAEYDNGDVDCNFKISKSDFKNLYNQLEDFESDVKDMMKKEEECSNDTGLGM